MQIQCNDQQVSIHSTTLEQALIELGFQASHIATAVNGEFVPKTERAMHQLRAGDKIEVLSPMQGG